MIRIKRWALSIGLVILFIAGSIFAIDTFGLLDFDPVIEVTVAPISRTTVVARLWAEGKVASAREVTLTAAGPGEIMLLAVAEGDTVQQGQLLVRMETANLAAQTVAKRQALKSRQAQVDQVAALYRRQIIVSAQAMRDWQRKEALFMQGVISASEHEAAHSVYRATLGELHVSKAQVQVAQRMVQMAHAQLSQTTTSLGTTAIYAPFSGIVSHLYVTRGQRVVGTALVAGTPLLDLFQPTALEVRANVAEDAITQLQVGDSANVEILRTGLNGGSTHLPGVVSYVGVNPLEPVRSPAAYPIRVRLLHPQLLRRPRLGTHANLSIITARRVQVPSLPLEAVTSRPKRGKGSTTRVDIQQELLLAQSSQRPARRPRAGAKENVIFIVQGKIVSRRPIRVGISGDNRIEVLSKFPLGTLVVSGPYGAVAQGLHTGSKILIKDNSSLDRTIHYGPTVEF